MSQVNRQLLFAVDVVLIMYAKHFGGNFYNTARTHQRLNQGSNAGVSNDWCIRGVSVKHF